jgi:predicted nucleotide-binding protein (sugar kinase/HSP70/actin superfamily)
VRGGECLPCPSTLGTFVTAVERSGSDPKHHALFMPTAEGPCRFGQYCTLQRIALDRLGWSQTPILSWKSEETYAGQDASLRRDLWTAIVLADVLVKVRGRVAPYERERGEADALFARWSSRLASALEAGDPLPPLAAALRADFLAVRREPGRRPLVGIVGEIYVRNNRFTNQDLVRRIEQAGGEAWLTPMTEWFRYLAYMEQWVPRHRHGTWKGVVPALLQGLWLAHDEKAWLGHVSPLLDDRHEPPLRTVLREGARHLPVDFEGEAILTLGRAVEFMRSGAALVVNCAPFGCMPGTLTASILQALAARHGVPVASLFFDGEHEVGAVLSTYLHNRAPAGAERAEAVAWAEGR